MGGVAGRIVVAFLAAVPLAGLLAGLSASAGGVTLEGRLEVLHEDDFASGRANFRYRLVTDQDALELRFADQHPALPRSSKVLVQGTRSGDTMDVAPGGIEPASGEPVAAITGAKKVAVILFNFANDTSQPYTPAFASGVAFSNPDSVAAYYAESSWNQLTLSGDVLGWYTIPLTNAGCDFNAWGDAADQQASAAGVDLTQYDYFVYAFPGAASCGWSGLAYLPGTRSWLNGSGAMGLYVMSHELGHNFGTHHSSSLSCVERLVRVPLSANPANCTADEYGDPFSVMGSGGNRHHTNFSRGNFSWLTPANTQDVATTGTYSLAPVEGFFPSSVQALRIEREPGSYLLLEFRQPHGTYFDNFSPSDPVVNGVTVRLASAYAVLTQSKLVDTTPSTTSFWDASLGVGKTLFDPKSNVRITTQSISANAAMVLINFPDTTPPTAPTNLTATPLNGSTISLAWSAASDDSGVAGYRIYRGGSFLVATTTTSYTDGGLKPGTTYSYYVVAVDVWGNVGPPSNTATAMTPSGGDTEPPTAPANLTATKLTPSVVRLRWSASKDNVGVTSYRIYRNGQFRAAVSGTTLLYVDVLPAGTHSYYVRAADAAGNLSPPSNTATATV